MKVKKIAILGAGNGGLTAAADLRSRGFEIRLFELPSFSYQIEPIRKKGGINLKTPEGEYFAKLQLITTDISQAISGAEVVMLVVPSSAIEKFAALCAPYIEKGQIIFINNAAAMGSIRFMGTVRSLGVKTYFKIGEVATLTYACRAAANDARAELFLRVKKVLFAAYPSKDTLGLLTTCREIYNSLFPATNVWETCLNNGNPESHPGPSLLNAGRIEYSKGEFYLYSEGITPAVSNIIKMVADERKALCSSLGVKYIPPGERLVNLGYSEPGKELYKQYAGSNVFRPIKGPLSLDSRYFSEDISMGLVLWSSLGQALSVATPVINSIITLGGALLGRDFWQEGLTLDKICYKQLGLMNILDL